jgi:hypothetical protein
MSSGQASRRLLEPSCDLLLERPAVMQRYAVGRSSKTALMGVFFMFDEEEGSVSWDTDREKEVA